MIPRPPIPTLFPTRRSSDLFTGNSYHLPGRNFQALVGDCFVTVPFAPMSKERLRDEIVAPYVKEQGLRSEEHTSELQSHVNLVCRLLLEKKNNSLLFYSLEP